MFVDDGNVALRACTLMRQLIRDGLELDIRAELAELTNRVAQLKSSSQPRSFQQG